MTDPIEVLDKWITNDGYGSRADLIARLQATQDELQDTEEAAEYAAMDAATAMRLRADLASKVTRVELLAERARNHGYDLDPGDVLEALQDKTQGEQA